MELMEINIELIQEKLKKILDELNVGIYEKERSIRLTLLSVLAGESIFLLGEPGTAKSLIARRISEAFGIQKEDFFCYLMNQFSQPDEVFGPVAISKLKCDEYQRKTEGYLPKAKFAFLDEIWKANPAIQNALLTILNEREFRNNGKNEKVDLIGFVAASNELPAEDQGLDAIFDRFLVRILEQPVSKDSDSFRDMISDSKELSPLTEKITLEEVKHIIKIAKTVKLSDECYDIIIRIAKVTSEQNEDNEDDKNDWFISDRRWKKIVNLMRVSALCNGRYETDIMDATLIADCIWKNEKQEEDAKTIVKEAIENYGLKCTINIENLEKQVNKFKETVDKKFFQQEVIKETLKTTTINNIEFYILEDSKKNIYKISKDIQRRESYYNYDYYYYNGTSASDTIKGNYIQKNRFQRYDNNEIYTIVKTPEEIKIVMQNFYKENPEEAKILIQQFNANTYQPILNQLNNALSSINQEIEQGIKKYGNNVFSDNNFYFSAITTKLTDSKVEVNELIKQLKKQKDRYDIY